METDLAHRAIHDERGARHVARALEEADEEKQNQNLREKHDNAADAGEHAVGEQVAQIAGGHRGFHPAGECGDVGVDPVHGVFREGEDREEQRGHDHGEEQPAPERVDDDGVDAVGERRPDFASAAQDAGAKAVDGVVAAADEGGGPVGPLAGQALAPARESFAGAGAERSRAGDAHGIEIGKQEQRLGAGDEWRTSVGVDECGLQFGDSAGDGCRHIPTVFGERKLGAAHGEAQLEETFAMHGFAGNDGHAEFFFETRRVDLDPGARGEIEHVQRDDDGPAEVENLVNEVEVPLEIGGVDNADDAVGLRSVFAAAEEHVAENRFIG